MKTKQVNVRLDEKTKHRLDLACLVMGKDRSIVVRKAIHQFLAKEELNNPKLVKCLEALSEEDDN